MKSVIRYLSKAAPVHNALAAIYEWTSSAKTSHRRLCGNARAITWGMVTVILCLCAGKASAQYTHDVSSMGVVTITANETHIFSGTSNSDANRIVVNDGANCTIHLRNTNITTINNVSPILIKGSASSGGGTDASAMNPTNKVVILLEGTNTLTNIAKTGNACAVLQVDQGAEIHIKAIGEQFNVRPDAAVNATGKLTVRKGGTVVYNETDRVFTGAIPSIGNNGAAIGAPHAAQGTSTRFDTSTNSGSSININTAGGNVIITSGIIVAIGDYHSAGIGGPHSAAYYNGPILILGGEVTAISGGHGAGVGSGCPTGSGVVQYCGNASLIIAIPPASVRSYTQQTASTALVPHNGYKRGLAGARDIVYIGDPESPLHFTVHTDDFMETTMYLNVSQNPRILASLRQKAPELDPARLFLGDTKVYSPHFQLVNGTAYYTNLSMVGGAIVAGAQSLDRLWSTDFTGKQIVQNTGDFSGAVTFYTDQANPKGYSYISQTPTLTPSFDTAKIVLRAPVDKPTMELHLPTGIPPTDTTALVYGYNAAEAALKACTLEIKNEGNRPLYEDDLILYLEAGKFTAEDGADLRTAILDSLHKKMVTEASSGRLYLPSYISTGVSVFVPTRLEMGLEPGEYIGEVLFEVPSAGVDIPPIPFAASVVRYYLDPPMLDTDPSAMTETNGPFKVTVTFNQFVRGIIPSDFTIDNGCSITDFNVITSPTYNDGTYNYYTTWAFTVDTTGSSIGDGGVIQVWANSDIAYERHGVRTTDISNVLKLKVNTKSPFATFYFNYDLPTDTVFLFQQDTVAFTITPNGTANLPVTKDSLYMNGQWIQDYNLPTPPHIKDLIEIRWTPAGGGPETSISDNDWDVTIDMDNRFLIEATPGHEFGNGDYRVLLTGDTLKNNMGNYMETTVGKFKVRIPELGCDINGAEDNAGLGIRPVPDSMNFLGGDAELILLGENLQYAARAYELRLELRGGGFIEPATVSAAGDSVIFRIRIPNNPTETEINYDFLALMFGDTAQVTTSACIPGKTKPVARITVKPAPAIEIENPDLCPQCGPEVTVWDPWTQGCENKYEAYVPKTGFDRVVTVTYLGLADKYLYSWGGGRPTTVVLPADEDILRLSFITARVPDELQGQKGAIMISTPSLPSDTSHWFSFWNAPDLSEMVYYPRTTMYEGLLDFNNQSGSPDMLRSFNGGATWESAWAPISGIDLERLEHEILFREPGSCCSVYSFDMPEASEADELVREVELPNYAFTVTDPSGGTHYVK
ncbi:MAG: carbohydrate-binding domain-containing protein, partial [Tannerella sp.]|nr:carbohydrate-binding domain-containing protein [Tannerella sp.]